MTHPAPAAPEPGRHRAPDVAPEDSPDDPGMDLEDTATETGPSAPVDTSRSSQRGLARAVASVALAALVATSLTVGYLTGQASYRTPPGNVTVVDAATDNPGFAEQLHATAAAAVVRISHPGGVGTGFFYAPGKVVTNAHVVTGAPDAADQIAAGKDLTLDLTYHDGRTRSGTVTAIDTRLDLAIITLPGPDPDVPVLPFTDNLPDPGAPLAVLGHPFGEGLMVTTGVLSGISDNSRFAESDAQSLLLQIDAAVNPGNSGGPVLDATGAVVGVVTLRPDHADGRAVAGLALAIPAPVAAAVLPQLDRSGRVAYPMLGVLLRDTTPDDPVPDAAEVTEVLPESGAAAAGLRPGDVILGVDQAPVTSARDVIMALVGRRPGQTVPLQIAGTTRRTVTVTLGAR